MNDISFFSTDELWNELKSRVDSAVLITVRRDKVNDGSEITDRRWAGGKIMALGLVACMKANLEKSLNAETAEDEDDTPT